MEFLIKKEFTLIEIKGDCFFTKFIIKVIDFNSIFQFSINKKLTGFSFIIDKNTHIHEYFFIKTKNRVQFY